MRVCFIVSTYEPETIGGQGEVVLKLQKQFLEHSVEAYVLTSGPDVQGYSHTIRTGSGKRLFYVASAAYLNWIRKMDFDVINFHLESGMSLAPFLAVIKCRAKVVTTLHDSYMSEWRSIGKLKGFRREYAHPTLDEYALKYLLTPIKFLGTYIDCSFSDRIIAVSARTGEECRAEYRLPREKMSVIYNGVDLCEFNPGVSRKRIRTKFSMQEKPVILTVGTATIRKGLPYLIQSMAEVVTRIPDAMLIVVGSRKYEHQMQLLTQDLGIQQHVIFAGPVERDELPFYYAASDVVAVPSISEGFPIVVLEALASGRPVVASRVGGIPEAVQTGTTGILFEPGNVDQLTRALVHLLSDSSLRSKMSREARKVAELRYDWKKVALQYLAEFKSVMNTA
ncbi:MAG: glycosyltransferase family 4 protein [Candidatus Bathyarchaeia archaeon]